MTTETTPPTGGATAGAPTEEGVRYGPGARVLSRRVRAVPPSGIRRFFDIIATMQDVISLGVGEPDFTTPPQIIEEGVRSLRSGRTHYTSNFGTLELRRALAANLERLYGVGYDPASEVLVTVGASEAVAATMAAIVDPGDEVILHEPSYVAYVPAIVFNGGGNGIVNYFFSDIISHRQISADASPQPAVFFNRHENPGPSFKFLG